MLPRIAYFLHHKPVERAKLIPEQIMRESPDVIVFQESYDGIAMRIIRKKLKAMYPYHQGFQNKKVITYKRAGGVIMFSKYPMKELESIKYKWREGINKPAAKGAMLVEVEHPAQKFQLLGTHMEAGGSRDLKVSQYKEAGELLKRHEQNGIPQFAAGDFNCKKSDSILYPKLVDALQMETGEITGELPYTTDHLLCDMSNYRPDKRNVIDYIFFRSSGWQPKKSTRTVKRFEDAWGKNHCDLSDHFAVLLLMEL